jgi:hypothetical protein
MLGAVRWIPRVSFESGRLHCRQFAGGSKPLRWSTWLLTGHKNPCRCHRRQFEESRFSSCRGTQTILWHRHFHYHHPLSPISSADWDASATMSVEMPFDSLANVVSTCISFCSAEITEWIDSWFRTRRLSSCSVHSCGTTNRSYAQYSCDNNTYHHRPGKAECWSSR